jgi:hypothetical protein
MGHLNSTYLSNYIQNHKYLEADSDSFGQKFTAICSIRMPTDPYPDTI